MWRLFILSAFFSSAYSWKCGGDRTEINSFNTGHRRLISRSNTLSPIRLSFQYTNSFSLGSAESDDYLKNTVVPLVSHFFAASLSVHSISGPLVLSSLKCVDVLVPIQHQTSGVSNSDVIIYVSSFSNSSAAYLSYSGACEIDSSNLHNVLAGTLAINSYKFTNQLDLGVKFAVLVHEMTHILGFSAVLFPHWKQSNGTPHSQVTATVNVRGTTKTVIVTPNVVQEARSAFGCSTLTGVELEEYNQDGSEDSHWDKRVMFNDYMTAYTITDPIFSVISLALLKDTGWYSVDYSLAQVPTIGRNAGCNFTDTPCITNGTSNYPLWCTQPDAHGCDYLALNKAKCSINNHTDLNPAFQYFSDPSKGGSDPYPDYCPYYYPYTDGSCRGLTPNTVTEPLADEVIGPNSRCFVSTLLNPTFQFTSNSAACYEVKECNGTGAIVQIGSHSIFCPSAGGQVAVPGYFGLITCPKYNVLCNDGPCYRGCLGYGQCIGGICKCFSGRAGADCSVICPTGCSKCTADKVCLECYYGYHFEGINCVPGTLLPHCAHLGDKCHNCLTGYYVASDFQCYACSTWCRSCVSAYTCTECVAQYYIVDGFCSPICISNCNSCDDTTSCWLCNQGFYYSASLSQCIKCPQGCLTCDSEDVCTSCCSGYYLNGDSCNVNCASGCQVCAPEGTDCIECIQGFGFVSTGSDVCGACPAGCKRCIEGLVCVECQDNFEISIDPDTGDQSCVKVVCDDNCHECSVGGTCLSCEPGFYLSNGHCYYCSEGCKTCTGPEECSVCFDGHYLNGTICGSCPPGCRSCSGEFLCYNCFQSFHLTNGGLCAPCSSSCINCDSSKCYKCEVGTYLSTVYNCCFNCSDGCADCDSTGTCKVCKTGYRLVNGRCDFICDSSCKTCDANDCFTCNPGYYLDFENKCPPCPEGCKTCDDQYNCIDCLDLYYLDKFSLMCIFCSDPNCLKCDESGCLECKHGYFNNNGVCEVLVCPDNCKSCVTNSECLVCNERYYLSGHICHPCSTGCSVCTSAGSCSLCYLPYQLNNGACRNSCDSNCLHCDSLYNCVVCKPMYFPNAIGICTPCCPNCVSCTSEQICKTCSTGYFLAANLQCQKCPVGCYSCLSETSCNACLSGYYLNGYSCPQCVFPCLTCISANICTSCQTNYNLSPSGVCQIPCPSNCKSCLSPNVCSVCYGGFLLQAGVCVQCPSGCSKCTSLSFCTECFSGVAPIRGTCASRCVPPCVQCTGSYCDVCDSGYYAFNGVCQPCTNGCLSCTGQWGCSKCQDRYYYFGFYCMPCLTGCSRCSSGSECLSCDPGFVLRSGYCYIA